MIKMKPMGWAASLLTFGIPALAMGAGYYLLMPFNRNGVRLVKFFGGC
jgi:hypothetical protein